jgi:hypothetical protein
MLDELSKSSSAAQRKIISYAYLAQVSRNEKDLVGGIASIFKPIAKLYAGKIFCPSDFCQLLDQLYGLKILPWAAQDLVDRLVAHDILIEHQVVDGVKQYIYAEISEEFTDITERDVQFVVESFMEYCNKKFEIVDLDIDKEKLSNSFLSHLSDLNFVSVALKPDDYLAQEVSTSALSLDKSKMEWKREQVADSRIKSLCAGFVVDAYQKSPALYELIISMVSGALVAEVVLNFQDPAKDAKFDGTNIILDTPFLMALLDLACEKEHLFAKQLCESMVEKGAVLAVFNHSVDELRENLGAVISRFKDGASFGATSRRLRSLPFHSYASQIKTDPEAILKKNGVRLLKDLTSDESIRIFDENMEAAVFRALGYYNNKVAQERDAKSIALTMRYRQGRQTKLKEFYNSRYIFLTENSVIPDKAMDVIARKGLIEDGCLPPALSARYMSGLMWVLFGAKGKDLPRQLLLANCAAALEPKNDLVKKMQAFLNATSPHQAELFQSLMGEERASQYLVQSTLGDATLLTSDNAVSVLQQLKLSLTEKLQVETGRKLSELEEKQQRELAAEQKRYRDLAEQSLINEIHLKATIKTESEDKKRLAEEISSLAERFDDFRRSKADAEINRINGFMKKADKRANEIKNYIGLAVFAVCIATSLLSGLLSDGITRIAVSAAGVAVSFLGFWFVPERLFGRYILAKRNEFFDDICSDFNVDISGVHLDWDKLNAHHQEYELSISGSRRERC